jgi:hypothetical protein
LHRWPPPSSSLMSAISDKPVAGPTSRPGRGHRLPIRRDTDERGDDHEYAESVEGPREHAGATRRSRPHFPAAVVDSHPVAPRTVNESFPWAASERLRATPTGQRLRSQPRTSGWGRATGVIRQPPRRGPALLGGAGATGRGHGAASRQRPAVNSQFAPSRSEGGECASATSQGGPGRRGAAQAAPRAISRHSSATVKIAIAVTDATASVTSVTATAILGSS